MSYDKLTAKLVTEITALRAEVEKERDCGTFYRGEIGRLRAENARLRELMQRAVDISKQHDDFKLWAMEPFTAALAQEKKDGE